ncbi:MAG: hypothetical protein IMZ54_01540 [Acidobacteria bacterium]|nr:hypothetical protein [Acidobacteriota bacterium]
MSNTPENVVVSAGCDDTSLTITWTEPAGFAWTEVSTEIERTSTCEGVVTVAILVMTAGTWCDQTVPLTFPEVCPPGDDCDITYRLRYVGIAAGVPTIGAWTAATAPEVVAGVRGTTYLYADGTTLAICPTETWARARPAQRFTPVVGGKPTVTTGSRGGRDYQLSIPSVGVVARDALADLLENPRVNYRTPLRASGWYAPHDENVSPASVPKVWVTTVALTGAEWVVADA